MQPSSQSPSQPLSQSSSKSSSTTRLLQRLPNLLTLFFSLTLVLGFRNLAERFHWTVAPRLNLGDWGDVLVLTGFATTLFFIVSVWLAFNVLIERNPYTLSFGRFYFDVARFAILNALLSFAFLADKPAEFHIYIFAMMVWHLMMVAWYVRGVAITTGAVRNERARDLRIHGGIAAVYAVLGVVYYLAISARWGAAEPLALYVLLVLLTYAVIVAWGIWRLVELRNRLLAEATSGHD